MNNIFIVLWMNSLLHESYGITFPILSCQLCSCADQHFTVEIYSRCLEGGPRKSFGCRGGWGKHQKLQRNIWCMLLYVIYYMILIVFYILYICTYIYIYIHIYSIITSYLSYSNMWYIRVYGFSESWIPILTLHIIYPKIIRSKIGVFLPFNTQGDLPTQLKLEPQRASTASLLMSCTNSATPRSLPRSRFGVFGVVRPFSTEIFRSITHPTPRIKSTYQQIVDFHMGYLLVSACLA